MDALKLFFNDIKNTELLTPEKEIELSKIIQGCSKCRGFDRCTRCRTAIDVFVIHNLPLVVRIARIYQGRDFPLQDLIGTGIYGLFLAALKFKHTKKTRFASYAAFWIKDEILKALRTCSGFPKLPLFPAAKIRKISKVMADLLQDGEDVTYEAIAARTDLPVKVVRELRPFLYQIVSIDDCTELVSDLPMPDIVCVVNERKRLIQQELEKILTPTQLYIITSTIDGLSDQSNLSLKEIAANLDIPTDKLRSMKKEIFTILRNNQILSLLYKEM